MTKIIYLPLDERPVNRLYPQTIMANCPDIEVITAPKSVLGQKKVPAPVEALWEWLEQQIADADYLVVSLDLLLYGGIVPSRLHKLDEEQVGRSLNRLKELKARHPLVKIYAFNLIMRVPAYNSRDEEPEYYEEYGERIYRWGWLKDQFTRAQGGTAEEKQELTQILVSIPEEIQSDYVRRRSVNHYVNKQAIELIREQILEFLVIPLDDCAEYGFSAAEQHNLLRHVEQYNLHDQIHIYPGADEVGCTLVTRIYNKLKKAMPRVFVRYSSTIGPHIIPRYEDRPLAESIKSQITVCGGVQVDNSLEADLILMVNSPTLGGRQQPGASEALSAKDTSFYSFRNLREFASSLSYYLEGGRKVALADVAFGNGADHELLRLLAKGALLGKLLSFGAWNTAGNTLGTVIAHALVRLEQNAEEPDQFLVDRLVEDWGYQTLVRKFLTDKTAELKISYFSLGKHGEQISEITGKELQDFIDTYLQEFQKEYFLRKIYFPWNRLFEVELVSKME